MFLDVGFDGQEILVDEIGGFLVLVRLGIQPSAGASGRSRTEVQQDGAALRFRCDERLIDVLAPIYGHDSPPGVMVNHRNQGKTLSASGLGQTRRKIVSHAETGAADLSHCSIWSWLTRPACCATTWPPEKTTK